MTQQLKYKVSGPVITPSEKKFVKGRNGKYVLSYNVSAATINTGRTSQILTLSELANQQRYTMKPKMLDMKYKSCVNNVLNNRACS